MQLSNPKSDCEVAVVGAGPYGLSVAAYLKDANIETQVFGRPMSFWRENMPKGMRLRSSVIATDLADRAGALTLQAYADEKGIELAYPVPIEVFIDYGHWFRSHTIPDLDTRKVTRIESFDERFSLELEDGDRVTADRVVMAMGLENHEFRPAQFAGLSTDLVSHTCEHDDLAVFGGKRIAVIGRGQSACESAALLNELGADVELVSRGAIRWLGGDTPDAGQPTDIAWHSPEILTPKSGVGPFPLNWLAEFPDLVRQMPAGTRAWFSARCLRPAAAGWLRSRVKGVRTTSGRQIVGARPSGSRVALHFDNGSVTYDHILLATGYHIDLANLSMFAPDLLNRVRRASGSPLLSTGFESSVPGLHFVGASSVRSYGPLMRFVAGSGYAARHLTDALQSRRSIGRRVPARAAQKPVFAQME